jgi:hypothetical protein
VTIETPTDANMPTPPVAPSFGWNAYAELINGRFAMMGFVLLLGLEFATGQDLWTWLGLR